jgi:TolB protein
VLVAALLALAPVRALAGIPIPVQGSRELKVAIAAPATPSGDPDKLAARLRDTIEKDLDLTGYFELVPTAAHIDRGGVEPGQFRFEDWKTIKVDAVAKLRLWPTGDGHCAGGGACLDVYLYDVLGGEKLLGKRFSAPAHDATAIAHQAASAILMALVGEPGFFGSTIVAVNERSGNKEIWLVDVTGDNARPVTQNGSLNLCPAWSPDHRSIAWTSYRRGNPDLYVKDLVSGAIRMLSAKPGLEVSPAYSPDGRYIALGRSENGDTDIWLIDAQTGKDVRRLTTGGGIDVSPHFSPDGSQIVFASERSGGSQIYVVPTAGGEARRLTQLGGFFTDPVFSPDGKAVAFVSRSGHFDVLTVRADGSGLTRITQDQGDNEDPSWSADGRYLVFTSTRSGGRRIWLATANGRHQVPITSTGGWSQPVWSR